MIHKLTKLFIFGLKVYTGFFLFFLLFQFFEKANKAQNPYKRRFYTKYFPPVLHPRTVKRLQLLTQFFCTVGTTIILGLIFLFNLAPFGVTMQYASELDTTDISDIGPKDRVRVHIQNGEKITSQTHDLTYFSTNMPFKFDQATVRVTFQNATDLPFSIGFKDQDIWHYEKKLFDAPLLNSVTWSRTGTSPMLYQRKKTFDSVEAFLANPPKQAIIGTYRYDTDFGGSAATHIASYTPQKTPTVIDTPLRGKHTMYVYLKNEPFSMTLQKQDLNWYEDADEMTVRVYKDQQQVFEVIAADDGITDASKKIVPPQDIVIKNPSAQTPEAGVYKVVIEANSDTVIKQIKTNLQKIVFQGAVFPIANEEVYGGIVEQTQATTLFTNALTVSATTYHTAAKQTLVVDDKRVPLHTLNQAELFTPTETISHISIPKNDVVLQGTMGYFAFSKEQFFLPTQYLLFPITIPEHIALTDYILTDYIPSKHVGEWQMNERIFNLQTAVIENGRLSWVIEVPKLQETKQQLIIKDIEVVFHKKPWI
jgi:hypothetical protein